MNDKVFFDSNVLIYAYDTRDPNKQNQAQELLLKATQSQTAVLSAQVLGEFYVVGIPLARPADRSASHYQPAPPLQE